MATKKKRAAAGGKKLPGGGAPDLILGFDLGGTKLASGVVTPAGEVLGSRRDRIDFTGGPQGFLSFLAGIAESWRSRFPRVTRLGIASCGPLDIREGILLQPTNFPRWGHIPVAAPLSARLGIPVRMHNDAAAVAGAEGWLGGARRMRNWMVLTFGTGLGTGIVMKRKVFMGGSGLGPEAGHLILTDKPYRCGCGNDGCAEAVLSGTALRRRIEERGAHWEKTARPSSPEELVRLARAGDRPAEEIFEEFSLYLARAIHNYAVMFNPEKIFIGGGLRSASDIFVGRTSALVAELLKYRPELALQIGVSELGANPGVLAGAWVATLRGNNKN